MPRHLAVLVAALVVGLTGCGGPDAQALLDGANEALEAAGTSKFEMTVEAAGDPTGRFSAEGAQDLATGALRMEIDLGDTSSSTETLLLGDEMFARSPLFAIFTGDESTWVRVDLAATAEAEGLDAETLLGGQTGPAALLGQLEGASGDLEELGSEEVRGVETTHLRVTIDTGAAIEQADPQIREQLRTYSEASGLPDSYPMELWIDGDGLVRRIRTLLDVPDAQAGDSEAGGVTQQTTLELFDFGVQVDLDRPLPEQTVELSELIAELEELERIEGEITEQLDEPADD
ncbi:MAG: hypothetical protein WEB09_10565 [Nitriliruptor sp.]